MAAVSVIEGADGEFYLKVNNHFVMGGTASYYSDRRQGHIPLLLHPHPKRALFLGLGTGATFAAAADYPGLEAEGVELIPEIIPLLRYFAEINGIFQPLSGAAPQSGRRPPLCQRLPGSSMTSLWPTYFIPPGMAPARFTRWSIFRRSAACSSRAACFANGYLCIKSIWMFCESSSGLFSRFFPRGRRIWLITASRCRLSA